MLVWLLFVVVLLVVVVTLVAVALVQLLVEVLVVRGRRSDQEPSHGNTSGTGEARGPIGGLLGIVVDAPSARRVL